MFRLSSLFTVIAVFCFSLIGLNSFAFAQDVSIPEVTNDAFVQMLLASMGGFKGATALVIVGIAIKILIAFLGTPLFGSIFKKVTGQIKLLIVSGLSIIAGVITQMSLGVTFTAALLQGASLATILVFLNQVYKQFFDKDKETGVLK